MSDTIKAAIISAIITGLLSALVSVLIFFLGNFSTQATIVETLSGYFDSVDKDMSYEQALQTIYAEAKQKDEEISILKQQNADYENRISRIPDFEFKDPMLIADGLKVQDHVDQSMVVIDNKNYFSQGLLNVVLKNMLSYDGSQNAVFYNATGVNLFTETRIDLFSTNVLYGGTCYGVFLPSEGKTFSMGSNTYSKGFVIYDDYSLFGDGDGYALFDLQGKYSKISFDVGRTNEYEKEDVVLKVYLNNEYVEEYSLNAQAPPIHLEINLNYANNMKLEITGGTRVKYGFANVVLNY